MESMINNFSKQEVLALDGFTGEFQQTFKEEILYNSLQSNPEGTLPPPSFYEPSIT